MFASYLTRGAYSWKDGSIGAIGSLVVCTFRVNTNNDTWQVIQTDQKELENTTSRLRDFVIQPPDKPQREQYSLHMQKGDVTHGTEKHGILFKRSEGIVRKNWQKRICEVGLF